jgi:hypothetical protein
MPHSSSFRCLLLKSARLFSDQINAYLQTQQLNDSLWQALDILDRKQHCRFVDIVPLQLQQAPQVLQQLLLQYKEIQHAPD